MEKAIKLLAVAIIIGCLLLSAAITFSSFSNRYTLEFWSTSTGSSVMVFDKFTGSFYTPDNGGIDKADFVKEAKGN